MPRQSRHAPLSVRGSRANSAVLGHRVAVRARRPHVPNARQRKFHRASGPHRRRHALEPVEDAERRGFSVFETVGLRRAVGHRHLAARSTSRSSSFATTRARFRALPTPRCAICSTPHRCRGTTTRRPNPAAPAGFGMPSTRSRRCAGVPSGSRTSEVKRKSSPTSRKANSQRSRGSFPTRRTPTIRAAVRTRGPRGSRKSSTRSARVRTGTPRRSSSSGTTGAASTTTCRRRSSITGAGSGSACRRSSSLRTRRRARTVYVSHTQYEFGSILKFVEDTFSLGRLGTTDVRATSIADSFDFAQSPRPFKPIPAKYSRAYFLRQPPSYKPVDTQ